MTGSYNETISIDTGILFDVGLSLGTNISSQRDALYLADGPWGLDYLEDQVNMNDFSISYEDREYTDNNFEVDRNPFSSGEIK